eukprot:gb/GECH01011521.1/.p1 GENE.gb/GECH01011521.1/~~gb/GECH01011521.1/.p1  ORF type:complete len:375 (+),score=59.97 gb/GECH01011521.1/:1-1125(+)
MQIHPVIRFSVVLFILSCIFFINVKGSNLPTTLPETKQSTTLAVHQQQQQQQQTSSGKQDLVETLNQLHGHIKTEKQKYIEEISRKELIMKKKQALAHARQEEFEVVDWMKRTGFKFSTLLQFMLTRLLKNPSYIGKLPLNSIESCSDISDQSSGYYFLNPQDKTPFLTYCEVKNNNAWTQVGKLGPQAVTDNGLNIDVNIGRLGERNETDENSWSHAYIGRWDEITRWILRIDVDVNGDNSLIQSAYYKPKDDVTVLLSEVGKSWRGTGIYSNLQVAFEEWKPKQSSQLPLHLLNWFDLPNHLENNVDGVPNHIFNYQDPNIVQDNCVDEQGRSQLCKKPWGAIEFNSNTGAMAIVNGKPSWSHSAHVYLKEV